jgi:predicted nucleotidyltransferase
MVGQIDDRFGPPMSTTATGSRDSVLGTLARNREAIRRFGVRSLGLFGSAARGEDSTASDLDFLVEFEHPTFDAYMDLKEFLENLFARPVDLVLARTLKPRLREPILRETVHAQGL